MSSTKRKEKHQSSVLSQVLRSTFPFASTPSKPADESLFSSQNARPTFPLSTALVAPPGLGGHEFDGGFNPIPIPPPRPFSAPSIPISRPLIPSLSSGLHLPTSTPPPPGFILPPPGIRELPKQLLTSNDSMKWESQSVSSWGSTTTNGSHRCKCEKCRHERKKLKEIAEEEVFINQVTNMVIVIITIVVNPSVLYDPFYSLLHHVFQLENFNRMVL